jgi:CRP-like cAMP-binding protein
MPYTSDYIGMVLGGSLSPFRDLDQKDRDTIARHITLNSFKRREHLFREGEKAKGLISLVSGKAKSYRTGVGGREHILRMFREQDLIGLTSLFTGDTWTSSVVALEDSVICNIEKQTLMRILRNNADLSMKFSRLLAEELSYSYDKMVSLTQKHVRGRLVESLLMLADIYGFEDDGSTINISLSRDDLAHLSNMTTSNAIRTLSNLSEEGNIKIRGRRITILNMTKLWRISEQA